MFAGKKSAQIREILINESAWEEMTCLFAPSLEIIEAARDIRVELDAHNYISNILTKLGIDRPSGLTRVMDLASRHPEWHQYVSEVTDWLQPVVSDLMERLPENDTVDIT
ncbi:TPA: hypothetical protein ACG5Q0_005078 [Escherichia coli]|uniref:Uncharacterized protein n=1 Tax=Escherichia coli TaxID=562 RepID=A0A075M9G1_ECOLX|nr:hypothetical protein [Escherichia coli]AIF77728.1 hypothetical protein [Escherichia coli]MCO7872327.1 hypothetical protein [Escherichia coli]MCO7882155.1 hypothetical protein [Escherichia coli]MCO7887075.1 hypothetical protein [Escherichia coli]MCO7891916.1 hypothetical protein [Escherichia coli]